MSVLLTLGTWDHSEPSKDPHTPDLALKQPREPLTDDTDISVDRFLSKHMAGDQLSGIFIQVQVMGRA